MQGGRKGQRMLGLWPADEQDIAQEARRSWRNCKSPPDKQKRPFGSRPSSLGGATGHERVVARRCVHPAEMATGRVHSATASPGRQSVFAGGAAEGRRSRTGAQRKPACARNAALRFRSQKHRSGSRRLDCRCAVRAAIAATRKPAVKRPWVQLSCDGPLRPCHDAAEASSSVAASFPAPESWPCWSRSTRRRPPAAGGAREA